MSYDVEQLTPAFRPGSQFELTVPQTELCGHVATISSAVVHCTLSSQIFPCPSAVVANISSCSSSKAQLFAHNGSVGGIPVVAADCSPPSLVVNLHTPCRSRWSTTSESYTVLVLKFKGGGGGYRLLRARRMLTLLHEFRWEIERC